MRVTPVFLAGLLLLAGCAGGSGGGGPPPDRSILLGANLTGAGATPPTDSAAVGTLLATIEPNGILNWELRFSGLSGPPTLVRFLDGATPVVDLSRPPAASPLRGSLKLEPARRADLAAGRWAAVIATAAHPTGEIRGPIEAAE